MNLQIRHPRARALAQELAARRNLSMTDAVIEALEAELRREERPLKQRVDEIVGELRSKSRAGGREMTQDEIDDMWGH